jgi:hypothetical protein
MPEPFKRAIIAVAVVCLVIYACQLFGVFGGHPGFPR